MRGFALKASTTGVSSKNFCSANYTSSVYDIPSEYYIHE